MNFYIHTHTRDDLLQIGTLLGTVFDDVAKAGPWMMTMGGDAAAGKSLIALSVDQVFEPKLYIGGITTDLSANEMMDRYDSPLVIFENFCGELAVDPEDFDRRLAKVADACPDAHVVMISNFWRTLNGEFNYQAGSLMSQKLDVNLDIFKIDESFHPEDESFRRKIILTVEKPELYTALKGPLHRMMEMDMA